ncbi:MAG: hypothetical protein MH472_06585 [Bacteroidia bacterium]|nr:hypothetical protein [Bacteroidia bacterium]
MKKLLAIAFVTVVLGSSCKKEFLEEKYQAAPAKTSNATKTADLKVSENFDWKTTQNISLTLTGYANARVQILTTQGEVIETSRLETNKSYTTVLTLPKTEKKVILSYMGQEVILDLNQNNIQYTFN